MLTFAPCFTACKKNADKKPACRIIAFTLGGQVFNMTYNGNGKLISVNNGSFSQTYDYVGDTTIVTSLNSGVFSSRAIAARNGAGLATNVRTELNATGTEWTNDTFEYNGDELSKQVSTRSADTSKGIITYVWFNHNMMSETAGSTTTLLDYYTDKPRQTGEYLDFFQFLSGYEYLRTKNLLKSFGNSTLTYEFGSDGNISSLTINSPGGTPAAINYQYRCN